MLGVGYGHHKALADDLVNSINYMSRTFMGFHRHAFLGFLPITIADYSFGVDINGENYTACHVFLAPEWFGDAEPETGNIRKNKPWILMFTGIDDQSFYARFRLEQDAVDYHNKIAAFNRQVFNRCFAYN